MSIRAPTAAQTAERSSDGSAWQSAPPIVPRLRTTGSAMTCSASVKIASRRGGGGGPSKPRGGEEAGLERVAVARHGADRDLAVLLADIAELGREGIDVDHVVGDREPQ